MVSDFLLNDCKVTRLSNGVAAGTTAQGSTFSRAGFDNVMVIVSLGTVVDASVITLALSTGDANDGSDKVAVSGATTGAIAASTSSNKDLVVEAKLNDDDYVTWDLTRATQNATILSAIAILYNGRKLPPDLTGLLGYGKGVAS